MPHLLQQPVRRGVRVGERVAVILEGNGDAGRMGEDGDPARILDDRGAVSLIGVGRAAIARPHAHRRRAECDRRFQHTPKANPSASLTRRDSMSRRPPRAARHLGSSARLRGRRAISPWGTWTSPPHSMPVRPARVTRSMIARGESLRKVMDTRPPRIMWASCREGALRRALVRRPLLRPAHCTWAASRGQMPEGLHGSALIRRAGWEPVGPTERLLEMSPARRGEGRG